MSFQESRGGGRGRGHTTPCTVGSLDMTPVAESLITSSSCMVCAVCVLLCEILTLKYSTYATLQSWGSHHSWPYQRSDASAKYTVQRITLGRNKNGTPQKKLQVSQFCSAPEYFCPKMVAQNSSFYGMHKTHLLDTTKHLCQKHNVDVVCPSKLLRNWVR